MLEKKRPMVSVIMLTYNHEKYIRQAIDSVLMQEVDFEYEILIGDDASTDKTVEILKEYKKKYPEIITLYLNNVNVGVSRNAYNLLIRAKGRYLATCEGDDYWSHKYKIKQQVEFLEHNNEFVGCTHLFTVIDENNNKCLNQYISWVVTKDCFTINDFQGMFLPGQSSTFVRRNLYYDNIIDLQYIYRVHKNVADKTIMLLYLMHGNFGLIKKNMSCYRRCYDNLNSMTGFINHNKIEFLKEDYQIIKDLENIALANNKTVNFNKGKRIIFSKAVYFFFRTLDRKYLYLAAKIYINIYDILFAIQYIISRFIYFIVFIGRKR